MKRLELDSQADSESLKNRRTFLERAGIATDNVALIKTDYDTDDFTNYYLISDINGRESDSVIKILESDGLATTQPGMGILLPIADCVGVVLFDSEHGALMMTHSGRHNLVQNGAKEAVEFLQSKFDSRPRDLKVWLSPAAGAQNYPMEKYGYGDKSLQQIAVDQLLEAGVSQSSIMVDTADTTTDNQYYSHHMGDKNQRFATLVYLR
jgi:copper oxidase (laccase) domain-containing protein